MRVRGYLLLAVLAGLAGCQPSRPTPLTVPTEQQPPARAFQPERMQRAVEGRSVPQVRERLAGVWKFRVTVVGAVQDVTVGHFADHRDQSGVDKTGVISVRLPKDAGPGQTWEVEAAFDFDQPILREKGLLVWRFAKPTAVIRVG